MLADDNKSTKTSKSIIDDGTVDENRFLDEEIINRCFKSTNFNLSFIPCVSKLVTSRNKEIYLFISDWINATNTSTNTAAVTPWGIKSISFDKDKRLNAFILGHSHMREYYSKFELYLALIDPENIPREWLFKYNFAMGYIIANKNMSLNYDLMFDINLKYNSLKGIETGINIAKKSIFYNFNDLSKSAIGLERVFIEDNWEPAIGYHDDIDSVFMDDDHPFYVDIKQAMKTNKELFDSYIKLQKAYHIKYLSNAANAAVKHLSGTIDENLLTSSIKTLGYTCFIELVNDRILNFRLMTN
jgi:hypothetical protein